ncbi:MAG: hypothetical protein A3B70_00975 [Deltaproteobacteria bacterium RIFCSPHIGHO2_02_FULL_40_11]|nr:MAG: hypothetical protein A3B70_00975 [Deltaproteobacteria bacterium RIFCSPHIGHO2_02_FULL_40_11]
MGVFCYNLGMRQNRGQSTLEYIGALVITIVLIGFFISQLDLPIRMWWDTLARKVAAPCPAQECVDTHTEPTVTE